MLRKFIQTDYKKKTYIEQLLNQGVKEVNGKPLQLASERELLLKLAKCRACSS